MSDHDAAPTPAARGSDPGRRRSGPRGGALPLRGAPRSPSATVPPVLLSLAGLLVGACGGGEPTGPDLPGEPASLTLSADTVRLTAIGAGSRLTATVADANGIVLGEVPVSWSSADASVATVDGSGRVEAAAVGETQVTASAGDVSDAATVIVEQTAASVSVSPALAALYAIGDSVRYTATVRDANGHAIQGAAVAWTSADDAVATVDAAGWVTARANGSATITAAVGELSDEAAVVVEQRVASVGVTPSADTLSQHDVIELAATVRDANGVLITGAPVAWTTSAPTVATVDGGGKVTATGWGADAAIIATSGGVTGGAKVHVRDQIAFAGQPNGGGSLSIFVVNDDGSGAHLPSGVASDADPAWSPDGTKIAFSANRDGDTEIYVMNADGSSPTNLTNDGSVDTLPAWSPEGSRIAFRTTRGGNDDIYVMNADGSNPTRLTDLVGSEVRPAWRPRP